MKKNNTWNIRRLVDESFVPATQRIMLKNVGFLVHPISAPGCKFFVRSSDTDIFCQMADKSKGEPNQKL